MVHGTVKGLLGLISTLVLVVLLAAAGLAYRLSQGPLSLAFLTPAVENGVSSLAGGLPVTLADTALAWDANHHTLTLRLHDLRALGADNRVVASVPDAAITISGPSLLSGRIELRGVRLIGPHLRLLHTPEGGFALGLGEAADAGAAAAIDKAVAATLAAPAPDIASRVRGRAGTAVLEKVEVEGGDLGFDEPVSGIHWSAPRVDLTLIKSGDGISISVNGPLVTGALAAQSPDTQGEATAGMVGLDGFYRPSAAALSGTLHWTGLRPPSFAPLAPQLAALARFQFVSSGTAGFSYTGATGLSRLKLDASGGPGTVDATPWTPSLRVAASAIKGTYLGGVDTLVLDSLRLDLGGPKIEVAGRASGLASAPRIDATARADAVPLAMLPALWPATLAPNPREWILGNVSGGTIRHADVKMVASMPLDGSAEPAIDTVSGTIQGDGMAVHYLGALPSARGVAAAATFDKDSMTIEVKAGSAAGVTVKGGTIALTGFAETRQLAHFNLDLAAAVPDALKLIDNKPLGYASALGFDPAHSAGSATIALDLQVPLDKTVRLAQVALKVRGHAQGLAIPKAALGLDLADGSLAIDADPHGMDVSGSARLGTIPIQLAWRENFGPAAFVSRYQVKALLDEAGRKAVGLGDPAFQAPVIVGTVPVEAVATMQRGGRGEVALKADLGPVAMRLPGLNWTKAAGGAGSADASLRLNAGGVVAVPHFAVTAAGGLDLRGEVLFDGGSRPRRISLATAKWGRTDMKGTVLFKPDGSLGIDVTGSAFDASELVKGGEGESHVEEQLPLSVSAKLGRVWLSDAGSVRNVGAVLGRGARHWNFIRVDGVFDNGQPLHVEVKPTDGAHRALKVTSGDAGAVFAAFGVSDRMRGGTLSLDGSYDDTDPHGTLKGGLKIAGYRVVKAPLLARVLSIASLTGTVDVLSGDGIYFDHADVPFTLTDGVLTLKDARTAGTELGVTADGQVDLDHDVYALEGTIVPAYAINGLIGKIPLIGSILTGEKGGGLIAFTYSVKGPGSNPSVSVNPLSALTPGFLRGLFNVFDSGNGTKVPRAAGKNGDAPAKPPDGTDR